MQNCFLDDWKHHLKPAWRRRKAMGGKETLTDLLDPKGSLDIGNLSSFLRGGKLLVI